MDILICIDDTDNLESRGTGKLAAILMEHLQANGWGTCGPITRHQMLVHPDIPYTSHNSSMCFTAKIEPRHLRTITDYARTFLVRESAPGSDPALCVVDPHQLNDPDALIAFGRRAKTAVLTKQEAYDLAERLNVHLSEHGGTGMGVIGALAGCGLRLSGNDGRFRGHFQIHAKDNRLIVADLIKQTGVDVVKSMDGASLQNDEVVWIGEKVKAVLQNGSATLLVYSDPEIQQPMQTCWRTCTKEQLRIY